MKALIIYDSVFGNTEKIAQAMGASIGDKVEVEIFRVGDLKPEQLSGVKLLIVGSPTRAFNPTKPITDFLKQLPESSLTGVKIAAFDTRVSTKDANSKVLSVLVKVFGYAANPIAKLMEQKGGVLVTTPEGFFVKDKEGPLKDGELERASDWVKKVSAE